MPDCRYALVSGQGLITRRGNKQLSGMADDIANAARIVLILAAVDVNLLRTSVPPLSEARLKMALPHLVEEQLLFDPLDCVIVAGSKRKVKSKGQGQQSAERVTDNMRLIAVVQRDWLLLLVESVRALGGRHLQVVPAQLCLPLDVSGAAVAVVTDHGGDVDVALRIAAEEGIGWLPSSVSNHSNVEEVLIGIEAVLPGQPVILYVSESSMSSYQALCTADVSVRADDWSLWINGAQKLCNSGMDLMQGLQVSAGRNYVNWHRWRWPLGLVTGVLLVNIVCLNVDWWNLRREASSHRSGMIQRYRNAYPNEVVIIDPIAQVKQKIATSGRDNGRIGPDDFIALAADLGESWSALQGGEHGAIAALEYHDRQLLVRFKSTTDADAAEVNLKKNLDRKRLTLSRPAPNVLQIGMNQ